MTPLGLPFTHKSLVASGFQEAGKVTGDGETEPRGGQVRRVGGTRRGGRGDASRSCLSPLVGRRRRRSVEAWEGRLHAVRRA
jgi:hypothetical protein